MSEDDVCDKCVERVVKDVELRGMMLLWMRVVVKCVL